MSFNIFTTLSKDNKELIHSAFIKFLLLESPFFCERLLGVIEALEESNVQLEVKLNKSLRADILINKGNHKILIENKFKCLPYEGQLNAYSKYFEDSEKQHPLTKKLLFYFQKGSDFMLPNDWKVFTYSELNDVLTEYLCSNPKLEMEKKVFIQHYQRFLQRYIDAYELLKYDSEKLSSPRLFGQVWFDS